MSELFKGSLKEQEARIDYLVNKQREAYRYLKANKDWDFSVPIRLFFKTMYYLNPQLYGPRIERYFRTLAKLEKVNVWDNLGDSCNKYGCFFEIKVSYKDYGNAYNFIQLRPWQNITGYCFITVDPDSNYDSMCFYVPKEALSEEVKALGCLAHGNKISTKNNATKEYKIQLKIGSAEYQRWVHKYCVGDLKMLAKLVRSLKRSDAA